MLCAAAMLLSFHHSVNEAKNRSEPVQSGVPDQWQPKLEPTHRTTMLSALTYFRMNIFLIPVFGRSDPMMTQVTSLITISNIKI